MVPYINTPKWQEDLDKNKDKEDLAVEEEYLEFRQAIIKRAEKIFKAVEAVAKNYIDDFRRNNRDIEEVSRHEIDDVLWKSNNGGLWNGSSMIDNLIVKRRWQQIALYRNDIGRFCKDCLIMDREFVVAKMELQQTDGLDKYIRDNLERFIEAWQDDVINLKQKKKIDAIKLKPPSSPTPKPSRRRVLE